MITVIRPGHGSIDTSLLLYGLQGLHPPRHFMISICFQNGPRQWRGPTLLSGPPRLRQRPEIILIKCSVQYYNEGTPLLSTSTLYHVGNRNYRQHNCLLSATAHRSFLTRTGGVRTRIWSMRTGISISKWDILFGASQPTQFPDFLLCCIKLENCKIY